MSNKEKTKYDVLSPDGFSISREEVYDSPKDARKGLLEWIDGFKIQGYYSSMGKRIPLTELEEYCTITPIQ